MSVRIGHGQIANQVRFVYKALGVAVAAAVQVELCGTMKFRSIYTLTKMVTKQHTYGREAINTAVSIACEAMRVTILRNCTNNTGTSTEPNHHFERQKHLQ